MGLSETMAHLRGLFPKGARYSTLPSDESAPQEGSAAQIRIQSQRRHRAAVKLTVGFIGLSLVAYLIWFSARTAASKSPKCDSPEHGFQCAVNMSHSWGQYSPYFSVPSEIDAGIPRGCELSFAQVLSRHGARDPTFTKSMMYRATVARIHRKARSYGPGYEFIQHYKYKLGADHLTAFGQQHMINSGLQFYHRYQSLARNNTPFIRASGQTRVIHSARKWAHGFRKALLADSALPDPAPPYPYPILVIPEGPNANNTLNNKLCTAFTTGEYSTIGSSASSTFLQQFAPPIAARLNANLPGVSFSVSDVPLLMDLCPFNTVASSHPDDDDDDGNTISISPFCSLFSQDEWASYDYYQSLSKWYGFGPGNPLGPTQGVGWVNELLARLTGRPVTDGTSSNSTLDGDAGTFPLGRALYADFSHDNDMTGILGALGLYDGVVLPNGTRAAAGEVGGYSASWTVPFAGRVYVEKMRCGEEKEELVRVLVNDRVVPLRGCEADGLGRCRLEKFVEGMEFARRGGRWDLCW